MMRRSALLGVLAAIGMPAFSRSAFSIGIRGETSDQRTTRRRKEDRRRANANRQRAKRARARR